MKSLMLLLALGLAASEKLDRTYLPPPGSKYAGGEPGDLQAPLEFPKETYTTTAPFESDQNKKVVTIGDTKLVPGSDRGAVTRFPGPLKDVSPVTPENPTPFTYFPNTYNVPTTTTSYAFTQTTTFPPTEGFETTTSPLVGLPIGGSFGRPPGILNQPFNQGQVVNQPTGAPRPGFVQSGNEIVPSLGTFSGLQTSFPGQIVDDHPGTQAQVVNQYQGFPVSTASPESHKVQAELEDSRQGYTQHLGVQPPAQKFNQQSGFTLPSPAPGLQINFPSQYNGNLPNIQGTTSGQRPVSSNAGPQQTTTQYVDKYGNIQSTAIPGYSVLQQGDNRQQINVQGPYSYPTFNQYGGNSNIIPGRPDLFDSTSTTQQGQYPQLVAPKVSLIPNAGAQNISVQGLTPDYYQRPQLTDQQVAYQSNVSQGPSLALPSEINQQGGQPAQFSIQQQGVTLPSTVSQSSIQGNKYPQFVNQQNAFPSTTFPQPQNDQRPQINGQQTQEVLNQKLDLQKVQLGSQQELFPSTFTPDLGTHTSQQYQGQLQSMGQQGLISSSFAPQNGLIPGKINYQQPTNQQYDATAQRASVPSTATPHTQGLGHSSQQTGIYGGSNRLPGDINPVSSIVMQEAFPGQLIQQESQQRFPVRPGDSSLKSEDSQNLYGAGLSTPGFQEPFSLSTPPSSIPSYGTTAGNYTYPTLASSNKIISDNNRHRPERPQAESDRNAVILNYETVLTPEGYSYSFDTSNGIHADENGTTIDGTKANGSYSYIGDDGKLYSVTYTADENGFRPYGDHLPTPPPVPAAIQRVIEQAAKDKAAGISHDGFYDENRYGHKKYQARKKIPMNGVDFSEENESILKENRKKYRIIQKGGSEPVTPTKHDDQQLIEYDETKLKNDDDFLNDNKYRPFTKPSNRRKPSGGSVGQNPEQGYESEQEKNQFAEMYEITAQQVNAQQIDQRRPLKPTQDISRSRPKSPYQRKPDISKEQYNNVQNYDNDSTQAEDAKDFNDKLGHSHTRIPSKAGETMHSGPKEDSQQNESPDRNNIYNYKKHQINERPDHYETEEYKNAFKKTTDQGIRFRKPVKTPLNNFEVSSHVTDSNPESQNDYQESGQMDEKSSVVVRPKDTKKTGFFMTGYEETSKPKFGNTNLEDNKYPNDLRYSQDGRPLQHQRIDNIDALYPEQISDEETGYQYTPPKNKFDQRGNNKFPSRLSETVTTKPPGVKYETDEKGTTVQPFITPNVHRGDDESYEENSEEKISLKEPGKEIITTPRDDDEFTDNSSEYSNEPIESEQSNDEGIIHTKSRPKKPGRFDTIDRPGYHAQQTIGKPQFYDDYKSDDDETVQRGSQIQGQKQSDRFPVVTVDKTKGKRPGLGTTRTSTTPMYKYGLPPTSTKGPFDSGSIRSSEQEDERLQNPTTYEPSDSTEENFNEDAAQSGISRNPTTKPGNFDTTMTTYATDRPGSIKSTSFLSSRPTSRPLYEYSEEETVPESPIMRPGSSRRPSFSTMPTIQTSRPEAAVTLPNKVGSKPADRYYSVNEPSSITFPPKSGLLEEAYYRYINSSRPFNTGPGFSTKIQSPQNDLPSTTYRPKYTITGTSKPGFNSVDTFGRPLQPTGQPGTAKPGLSVASGQEILSTRQPSTVYQGSGVRRPGKPGEVFKSTEPRFGGPSQRTPGPKPAEFGPSSVTTPGYLQPYSPTSQRVIGEDFSGPKQPQKFDPETGYYY